MISDHVILGNSSQGGTNTCALHTSLVPVLIADGLPLNSFGENSEERNIAAREMRRRMMLSFRWDKYLFETENDVEESTESDDDGSDNDGESEGGNTRDNNLDTGRDKSDQSQGNGNNEDKTQHSNSSDNTFGQDGEGGFREEDNFGSNSKDDSNIKKINNCESSREKREGKSRNKPRELRIQLVNKLFSVPKCAGCKCNIRRKKSCNGDNWEIVTGEGQHYCIDCLEYFEREEKWKIFELVRQNQEVDVHTKEHFSDIMKDLERFPSFAYVGNKKK